VEDEWREERRKKKEAGEGRRQRDRGHCVRIAGL
jgi:hypothetical protein